MVSPKVTVTTMPTNQIRTVLVTSQILLAIALMYLVTDTPQTLKVVMEKTPRMPEMRRMAVEDIDLK